MYKAKTQITSMYQTAFAQHSVKKVEDYQPKSFWSMITSIIMVIINCRWDGFRFLRALLEMKEEIRKYEFERMAIKTREYMERDEFQKAMKEISSVFKGYSRQLVRQCEELLRQMDLYIEVEAEGRVDSQLKASLRQEMDNLIKRMQLEILWGPQNAVWIYPNSRESVIPKAA